jgi:hypothetical protein
VVVRSNMVVSRWDGSTVTLVVSIYTSQHPTDREWDQYLEICRALETQVGGNIEEKGGALVITDGAAPSTRQREQLNEFLRGRHCRAAIVTSSFFARSITTALSWFNRDVKAFAPNRYEQALRHVRVAPADETSLWKELVRLAAGLPGHETLASIRPAAA